MRIGDFAARAGLTARQVRHYTDTGLVPAIRLSNNEEIGRASCRERV